VLAVGGDPGEAALLWFDHAVLGGVTIPNLSTVVSGGVIDAMSLFRTRLPYRPGLLPLNTGDRLVFRGFTFDGARLGDTGPVDLRWR